MNYTKGLSPVSLVYGKDEIGFLPDHTLRVGLDFKYVQLSLGYSNLKKVVRGSDNLGKDDGSLFLPLFSLGGIYDFNNYSISLLLISVPTPVLRTSFTVLF